MKVFVDTNIIIELFENRKEADLIDRIFAACEKNNWERYLSVGSFYTLTYLTERILRKQGFHQPDLVDELRKILADILDIFSIAQIGSDILRQGISNQAFLDLEDSYQHQSALNSGCDVLLTINKKDFELAKHIKVLTPQEFIREYL